MKIAVFTNERISSGGGYQAVLNTIEDFSRNSSASIEICYYTSNKKLAVELAQKYKNVTYVKITKVQYILFYLRALILRVCASVFPGLAAPVSIMEKIIGKANSFESRLIKDQIKLIYFVSPEPIIMYINNINYIMTVWDLSFLDYNFLPEIKSHSTFEVRDKFYAFTIRRAYKVVVDSKHTKDLINANYGYSYEHMYEIPFRPSGELLNVDEFKANLEQKYIFYPAQYWPHKNHKYVLDAISIVNQKVEERIKVVFTGSDKGFKSQITDYKNFLCLEDQVEIKDFVSYSELKNLYINALAVVMPSFIGPTNMPTLEAIALNIPCIYTGWEQNRHYYGDSLKYCDLSDPVSLAEQIIFLSKVKDDHKQMQQVNSEILHVLDQRSEAAKLEKAIADLDYFLKCLS